MTYRELDELCFRNQAQTLERKAWLLRAPESAPSTACVFLDGELYLERVQAADVLARLRAEQENPGVVALFVSSGGAAARHQDFVCCPKFASFVAEDVVAQVRSDFPTVHRFVLIGLSLSGLAAAFIASRYPQAFQFAVCQSPSFWWERARFAAECPAAQPPAPALWVCVGNQETDAGIAHPPSGLYQELTQIAGCALIVARLRAQGYSVCFREFAGGHDPACWGDDLALALSWACSARSTMDSSCDP